MSFGSFLRSERKLRGYTQEDAANVAGVVVPVVSKWENDKSVPDLAAVCALCRWLDLRIDEWIDERRDETLPRVLPPVPFDAQTLGEACKKLRIQNGLSQGEAGAKLYVTSQTVSKWENGGITSLEIFTKLAALYNISPVELLCGYSDGASDIGKTIVPKPRKSFVTRIAAAVAAVLLAVCLTVGGIFIGRSRGTGSANITPANPNTPNEPSEPNEPNVPSEPDTPNVPSEPKEYATLTYHFPDGTTQAFTLKVGVEGWLEPKYDACDAICYTYDGNNGELYSLPAGDTTLLLYDDLDVYPVCPKSIWVDIAAATTPEERLARWHAHEALGCAEGTLGDYLRIMSEFPKRLPEIEEMSGVYEEASVHFDVWQQMYTQSLARVADKPSVSWAATRLAQVNARLEPLGEEILRWLSDRFPVDGAEKDMTDEQKRVLYLPLMEEWLRAFGDDFLQLACLLYDTDDKAQCLSRGACSWYREYRTALGKDKVGEILGV